MDDPGPVTPTPGERWQAYEKDRAGRRLRRRLVGFLVTVPIWVVSVVPLARESIDGREGARAAAVYLAAGAFTLGIAAVIRGLYALLRKRHFWSPWLFVVAAVVAVLSYSVQSAGDEVVPISGAPIQESSSGPLIALQDLQDH
jgi:cation transport ATPase